MVATEERNFRCLPPLPVCRIPSNVSWGHKILQMHVYEMQLGLGFVLRQPLGRFKPTPTHPTNKRRPSSLVFRRYSRMRRWGSCTLPSLRHRNALTLTQCSCLGCGVSTATTAVSPSHFPRGCSPCRRRVPARPVAARSELRCFSFRRRGGELMPRGCFCFHHTRFLVPKDVLPKAIHALLICCGARFGPHTLRDGRIEEQMIARMSSR